MVYHPDRMRFGSFIAPYHPTHEDPTLTLERDMQLVEHLDRLGYDEAWIGEHHSGGYEIISSPELFIAGVAGRTKNIRFGTGVNSLTYHHPLILADRIAQLDHQVRGRLIFGSGPGQLPTDAYMMGIDPLEQRRMMNESLECLIELFEGRTVTRQTDWFTLRDARLQVLPYQTPRMEMSVACAVTPTGPTTAGRLGLGMLSLAASTPIGFTALGQHWDVYEETAKAHGKTVTRDSWRVVVNMHVAETREQAMKDVEWGIMDLVEYIRGIRGAAAGDDTVIGRIRNAKDAVKTLTTEGIGTFGVAMIGDPQDAIAHIEKLQEQSGGFGTFMFLAHNCADFEATKKSYELFARHVIPHVRKSNRNRAASLAWSREQSATTYGGIVGAMKKAISEYEDTKTKA
ncbi:MAG: LLM class flavin-dependent oxidoreductase [Alphaproteobacteria bacterium]|nr:LLM class flavin-dependent oxidoreductase [Alphaproteobacteria bacterium]MBU1516798.1 LLM class flavin-dependent oxidoreductase [Alphaproteobacteria bacterium]MBU2092492.1 LLM class flavin-dependent oxidoreductase [Alphaproteobacteria bacterium]MBU2152377.1 LLM class flavin-dependent oxidoreductase [Alphaproteobacteria bacterium]MBU2305588.1 LLM class flavin-dependent oxidoreductase [Alphaproteobacteria bacterium]